MTSFLVFMAWSLELVPYDLGFEIRPGPSVETHGVYVILQMKMETQHSRTGVSEPTATYLWPLGGAGAGKHHGQAGMQRPRRSPAAGPFLSKLGPILSAFPACSWQCVIQEGSKGDLC